MKYGFVLPTNSNARVVADFACYAEAAGWDGFFVWEPVWGFGFPLMVIRVVITSLAQTSDCTRLLSTWRKCGCYMITII
jgi:hypothetical protein